jgi:uncharacterized membrane protein YdjX (TVP38/TMEM64 family)
VRRLRRSGMQHHDQRSEAEKTTARARSAAGAAGRPRSVHHALLFAKRPRWPRGWWVVGLVVIVLLAAAGGYLIWREVDWSAANRVVDRLDALPLLAAMAVLPLIGFPILPVYLVAGARFGPIGGGVAVAWATAVHLAGSYVIARTVLRGPLERVLARWHAHLPEIPRDEEPMVALIAALVPGLPYVVRNYLLATMGLRLRVYFWICLPIYVARSYVSILLGHMGGEADESRLLILGALEAAKVVICAYVIWRLREHHRRFHGEHWSDAPVPRSG